LPGAGLGDDGFVGIEFDFDGLKIVAKYFVIDFVTAHVLPPLGVLGDSRGS
jgi:hypothetical protein